MARAVAARATRNRKTDEPLQDLMFRWQAELTALGYPPAALDAAVEAAGLAYRPPALDLEDLAGELLAPGVRLASEKTLSRGDVIVAVAAHLHGLPVRMLDQAVDVVLAHTQAVRLPAVVGAREAVWAAACVLADEQRVAELADAMAGRAGAQVHWSAAPTGCDQIEVSPLSVMTRMRSSGNQAGRSNDY